MLTRLFRDEVGLSSCSEKSSITQGREGIVPSSNSDDRINVGHGLGIYQAKAAKLICGLNLSSRKKLPKGTLSNQIIELVGFIPDQKLIEEA